MNSRPLLLPSLLKRSSPFSSYLPSRSASLNSAINRGLRRSPRDRRGLERHSSPSIPSSSPRLDSPEERNRSPTRYVPRLDRPDSSRERDRSPSRFTPRFDSAERDYSSRLNPRLDSPDEQNSSPTRWTPRTESNALDFSSDSPKSSDSSESSPTRYTSEIRPSASQYFSRHPLARPSPRLDFTAPPPNADWTPRPRRHISKTNYDSEWIYGTSAVEAVLKAKKRTFYKLHILTTNNRSPENQFRDRKMSGLAADANVTVVEETDAGLLDSMSNSRPHNGYVLECLPLPKTPILSLGPATKSSFDLNLAQHHHTTGAPIDPSDHPTTIRNRDPTRRYPFVLMLDEILDPGNLGAILRSAYYLGVDAITLSSRNCAPLSPVCLKASSGAAELLPILEQARSDKLITSSAESGWTVYAGVPPPTKNQARRDRYVFASEVGEAVKKGPVLLVLGGEGEGVRPFLKKHVAFCVSLDKGPGTDAVVDSLNVSVAAALLCSSFLKWV